MSQQSALLDTFLHLGSSFDLKTFFKQNLIWGQHKGQSRSREMLRDYRAWKINSLPLKRGQSCATRVIPPEPKYWPIATSWKKIGIPQNVIAMKYTIRNAPEKKKENHRCNLQSKILESKNNITQIFISFSNDVRFK